MSRKKLADTNANVRTYFTFNLSRIRFGLPSTEHSSRAVLDKINGLVAVAGYERDKNGQYIDYYCKNKLTLRLYNDNRVELVSNDNNQISPANHIKLVGSEIINTP